jgi:hypothetical protein
MAFSDDLAAPWSVYMVLGFDSSSLHQSHVQHLYPQFLKCDHIIFHHLQLDLSPDSGLFSKLFVVELCCLYTPQGLAQRHLTQNAVGVFQI